MECAAQTFFVILLTLKYVCCQDTEWNTNDYLKREYTLVKPYSDGRWDYVGSTLVTNQFVRLTQDHQSQRGGVWNNVPNRVKNWELHVQFKVHGEGRDLFGDGLAIWYAKDRLALGDVFGSRDYFSGLSIFLDTYSNHNGPHNHAHPYISAMINNGSLHYDHDRDGTHTEVAGCESKFRNVAHDTFVAIRYEYNTLTVSTDVEGKNAWKRCFSVSGVKLPTGYYFGASAATGELADNHDIISMKFYDIDVAGKAVEGDNEDSDSIKPSADFFAPPRDHIEDDTGGFMSGQLSGKRLLVIIVLAVIGVGVCAVVGFVVFSNRSEAQRKRFY